MTLVGDIAGPDDGPLVVLLHGGSQTRHSWGTALTRLADSGFRACALDLRGHGESSWSADGEYQIVSHVGDITQILQFFGRPAALVGASLGGAVGLVTAAELPAMVSALVLVDIAPRPKAAGVAEIVAFMRDTLKGFDTVDEAADAVARYLPHRPRPPDQSGLLKNLRLRDDGRFYWHWDPRLIELGRDPEEFERFFLAATRRVTAPTLILRAGRSELVTPLAAKEFAAQFPNARAVEIEGAHHMIAGDRNDAFNEAMIEFLKINIPHAPTT